MNEQVRGPLQEFKSAAGAAEPVLVPIEPDIAAWFRRHGDMTREINNLCRFYMETGLSKELEFSEAASHEASAQQSLSAPKL